MTKETTTQMKAVYKIKNGKAKPRPIKTAIVRFFDRLFPCQHAWKDIAPYQYEFSKLEILFDESIAQVVSKAEVPTHQCNKCGIALLKIRRG